MRCDQRTYLSITSQSCGLHVPLTERSRSINVYSLLYSQNIMTLSRRRERSVPASFFHFQEVQTRAVRVPATAVQRTTASTKQQLNSSWSK